MQKSIAAAVIAAAFTLALGARADDAKPAAPPPPSSEEARVTDPGSAKFAPATTPGMPPGPQTSLVGVDPTTKGSVAYARLPAGYHLPMHWHSQTEYTSVVSGKGILTLDGKKHELAAGSYFVVPPRTHHEFTCAAGAECVLLTRRGGPTDYNWVEQK